MHSPALRPRALLVVLAGLCLANAGCLVHHRGFHHHHHARPAPAVPPPPPEVPRELNKVTLPPYMIEPPDVLLIEVLLPPREAGELAKPLTPQPITGQHLVRPDGSVNLGIYGSVQVSGLSLDQAALAIRYHLAQLKEYKPESLQVIVDVFAYNSKSYYVITDGAGYGEQVYRFPITGSETVLDAIGQINGLPVVASKRNIWVARRTPVPGHPENLLPVDWCGITQHGVTATNYQLMPGDRVYVKAERIFSIDNAMAKFFSPVERVLGLTLLGSTTYNSIAGRNLGMGGP